MRRCLFCGWSLGLLQNRSSASGNLQITFLFRTPVCKLHKLKQRGTSKRNPVLLTHTNAAENGRLSLPCQTSQSFLCQSANRSMPCSRSQRAILRRKEQARPERCSDERKPQHHARPCLAPAFPIRNQASFPMRPSPSEAKSLSMELDYLIARLVCDAGQSPNPPTRDLPLRARDGMNSECQHGVVHESMDSCLMPLVNLRLGTKRTRTGA